MAKWIIPSVFVALGIVVFGAGAFYGVITVGVPTPHAPPEVAAREARDFDLSGNIMDCGILLAGLGMVSLAVVAVLSWTRRDPVILKMPKTL